jgi:phosphoglycolate phosphatase
MLKGIIFDLDGTLIDSFYDWKIIRKKIGVDDLPILTHIHNLKEPLRKEAMKILESFEKRATEKSSIHKGMRELLDYIDNKKIKKAIVTNNSRKNVDYLLDKWKLSFDVIITRDDGIWKPSGTPLLKACEKMKLTKDEVIYVGNSNPDRIAAQEADITFISMEGKKGIKEILSLLPQ